MSFKEKLKRKSKIILDPKGLLFKDFESKKDSAVKKTQKKSVDDISTTRNVTPINHLPKVEEVNSSVVINELPQEASDGSTKTLKNLELVLLDNPSIGEGVQEEITDGKNVEISQQAGSSSASHPSNVIQETSETQQTDIKTQKTDEIIIYQPPLIVCPNCDTDKHHTTPSVNVQENPKSEAPENDAENVYTKKNLFLSKKKNKSYIFNKLIGKIKRPLSIKN